MLRPDHRVDSRPEQVAHGAVISVHHPRCRACRRIHVVSKGRPRDPAGAMIRQQAYQKVLAHRQIDLIGSHARVDDARTMAARKKQTTPGNGHLIARRRAGDHRVFDRATGVDAGVAVVGRAPGPTSSNGFVASGSINAGSDDRPIRQNRRCSRGMRRDSPSSASTTTGRGAGRRQSTTCSATTSPTIHGSPPILPSLQSRRPRASSRKGGRHRAGCPHEKPLGLLLPRRQHQPEE